MSSPFHGLDHASAWTRFAMAYWQMNLMAGEVIFRRSLMMMQGGMTGPEALGMMLEKGTAFAAATEKAAIAAARGGDPAAIATAALQPISARARSNVRKLRR